MNWDQLEANWTSHAEAARRNWALLTDDDWKAITGRKSHLTERIRSRYAISSLEAGKLLEDWSLTLPNPIQAAKSR